MEENHNPHGSVQERSPKPAEQAHASQDGTYPRPDADGGAHTNRRRTFPNVGDLLAMLGIFLVAQVIGTFVALLAGSIPISHFGSLSQAEMGRMLAISALVAYVLTFFGIIGYRRARGSYGRIAGFSLKGLNPILLLWGFVFMLAVGVVLDPLLGLLPAPTMHNYGTGLWTIVSLVLFAPVFEELICRGVVLESLRARYGVVAAWLVSSLFFGVVHLQPQLVVNAFFIGLILAYIYIRTDSLWPAMILHAVNNGVAYILLAMGCGSFLFSDLIPNRTVYTILYAVSAAICIVSGVMIWRTLRTMGRREKKQA